MSVPPVISLVTLGVADVPAATAFYEALGFERSSASVEGEVSFFRAQGAASWPSGVRTSSARTLPLRRGPTPARSAALRWP